VEPSPVAAQGGSPSELSLLSELLPCLAASVPERLDARELAELLWLVRQMPPGAERSHTAEQLTSDSTKQEQETKVSKVNETGKETVDTKGDEPADSGSVQEGSTNGASPSEPAPSTAALLPERALPREEDRAEVLAVWLEDPPLIGDSLGLLRSLAPLQGRVGSAHRRQLDEAATVEAFVRSFGPQGEGGWLRPVFQPLPEPRFELVLVVDSGASMRLWDRLVADLTRTLSSCAVFRDMKLVALPESNGTMPQVGRLCQSDPEGRRLLLLLSDCCGDHWWSGRMAALLAGWSRDQPLAVLQVLPGWMWERTALGLGDPLVLANRVEAGPNQRYRAERQNWTEEPPSWSEPFEPYPGRHAAVPPVVPVVSCDPSGLTQWSALVMGMPRGICAGFRLPLVDVLSQEPAAQEGSVSSTDAEELVAEAAATESAELEHLHRFKELASPKAQRLLGLMAASPVFTLPVMRLVRQALLAGDRTPLATAEVLLSGVVQLVPEQAGTAAKAPLPEQWQFTMAPEVRRELVAGVESIDAVTVFNAVSRMVEERWNRFMPKGSFRAFLTDPNQPSPEGLEGMESFARVAAEIVEGLGGDYRSFAEQLRRGATKRPINIWPQDQFPFESMTFETVQLLRIPEPEVRRFEWAQFEEIELFSIAFTTASIELDATSSSEGPAAPDRETDADQLPSEAAALIQNYEGCRLQAYPDPATRAEPITIGWGSTFYEDGSPIRLGDVISQEQADALYYFNFRERFWKDLKATIPFWSEMNDKQKAALCSFAYNNGAHFHGDGRHDTLDLQLRERHWEAIPGSLMMYRNPGTSVEVGLGRRRRAEGLVWIGMEPTVACTQAEREIATPADCEAWEQHLKQAPPTPASLPVITAEETLEAVSRSVLEVSSWTVASLKDSTWGYHEPLDPGPPTTSVAPPALTMLRIPAGSFLMGSSTEEPGRFDDEGPQHPVTLAEFFLARTPITQAQWREVASWQPLQGEPAWERELKEDPLGPEIDSRFRGDERPVVNVSWHDAMEFCRRLRRRTGKSYTLPSEAQWEYACRAGSTTPFHFGATISPKVANYDASTSYAGGPTGEYRQHTSDVGSFPSNAWGLQDMHGNVWEWCLDHWHGSYVEGDEKAPTDGSAWIKQTAEEGENRLLRGGSWCLNPRYCRSAYRNFNLPYLAGNNVGFRVCCLPQDLLLDP
jgi:formylglycine-generating enzyme required for sulfatase activity/GH24 family phage-related lysozyme (muramidase)